MKRIFLIISLFNFYMATTPVMAQTGEPYIHDPSTLAECDGKYYTFGTGGGGLISDDGWSWHSGADRPGGGAAPDVLKIGDRYRPYPHDVEQDPRSQVARLQVV